MTTPQIKKIPTPRSVSKQDEPLTYLRSRIAPSNASLMLLKNQPSDRRRGTPPRSWTNKCAGNTANRYNHQVRFGARSKAENRIAFGGQSIEMGNKAGF